MKSLSFDYDDTLSRPKVQEYAKELIKKGYDVHILTFRYEDPKNYKFNANHKDLFKVADRLGIKRENIHFTNYTDKGDWLSDHPELNFLWHLDDDVNQLDNIRNVTTIIPIDSVRGMWKITCDKRIKEYEEHNF